MIHKEIIQRRIQNKKVKRLETHVSSLTREIMELKIIVDTLIRGLQFHE